MKIVPRDQGSHLPVIVVQFSSFSTLKLVVHAIFYFEKFSETIESSNRDREFKNSLLPRLIAVGQGLPLWARFLEQWLSKRKRLRPLVRVLARSIGHVRSSVSARNDILMFCFFLSFLARRIGRSLEPTSFFFFLSFLGVGLARSPSNLMGSWCCIAYEQAALHFGESREVTREPHAKGDTSARGGELQSRAWSFACLGRFAQWTKKKEKKRDCSQSRERKESSPFPPPLTASRLTRALSRHLWWRACWYAT